MVNYLVQHHGNETLQLTKMLKHITIKKFAFISINFKICSANSMNKNLKICDYIQMTKMIRITKVKEKVDAYN